MAKLVFFAGLLMVVSLYSFAQSIELSGIFSTSCHNNYKNALGYRAGYVFKEHRAGRQFAIHASHIIKNAHYFKIDDDEYSSGPERKTFYFNEIRSFNQCFGLHISNSRNILHSETSKLLFGVEASYYYIHLNQNGYTKSYSPYYQYYREYSWHKVYDYKHRLGLSLLLESELSPTNHKRMHFLLGTKVGFISYDHTFQRMLPGNGEPWFISSFQTYIGLRYSFVKPKAETQNTKY